MQVINSANSTIYSFLTPAASSGKSANSDQKVEESPGAKMPDAPISPVKAIARRYDLSNISPREVDQLAHELNDSGSISNQDFMILLTRGAEFMSHMPGSHYTEERLNQKTDLIADFQNSLKMSQSNGAPTEGLEHLLATLDKIQSLGEEERGKTVRQPLPQLSDKTMSGLISLQSENKGIPVDTAKRIDVSGLELVDVPEGFQDRMHTMLARLFARPNVPIDETFAEVTVGGKVIAKILNGGGVESSNAMGAQLNRLLKDDIGQGPRLAEERAQKIAEAFGGEIRRASTARTQQQWNARPPITWSIDPENMAQHGYEVPADLLSRHYGSQEMARNAIQTMMKK